MTPLTSTYVFYSLLSSLTLHHSHRYTHTLTHTHTHTHPLAHLIFHLKQMENTHSCFFDILLFNLKRKKNYNPSHTTSGLHTSQIVTCLPPTADPQLFTVHEQPFRDSAKCQRPQGQHSNITIILCLYSNFQSQFLSGPPESYIPLHDTNFLKSVLSLKINFVI